MRNSYAAMVYFNNLPDSLDFFISYWLRGNPPGLVLTAVAVTLDTDNYPKDG